MWEYLARRKLEEAFSIHVGIEEEKEKEEKKKQKKKRKKKKNKSEEKKKNNDENADSASTVGDDVSSLLTDRQLKQLQILEVLEQAGLLRMVQTKTCGDVDDDDEKKKKKVVKEGIRRAMPRNRIEAVQRFEVFMSWLRTMAATVVPLVMSLWAYELGFTVNDLDSRPASSFVVASVPLCGGNGSGGAVDAGSDEHREVLESLHSIYTGTGDDIVLTKAVDERKRKKEDEDRDQDGTDDDDDDNVAVGPLPPHLDDNPLLYDEPMPKGTLQWIARHVRIRSAEASMLALLRSSVMTKISTAASSCSSPPVVVVARTGVIL